MLKEVLVTNILHMRQKTQILKKLTKIAKNGVIIRNVWDSKDYLNTK